MKSTQIPLGDVLDVPLTQEQIAEQTSWGFSLEFVKVNWIPWNNQLNHCHH